MLASGFDKLKRVPNSRISQNLGEIIVFSKCGRVMEKEKKCGRNTRDVGD